MTPRQWHSQGPACGRFHKEVACLLAAWFCCSEESSYLSQKQQRHFTKTLNPPSFLPTDTLLDPKAVKRALGPQDKHMRLEGPHEGLSMSPSTCCCGGFHRGLARFFWEKEDV